jgi:hypothetical protein
MAATDFKGGTSKVATYDQSLAISLNDVFTLRFDYSCYSQSIFPILGDILRHTSSFLSMSSD